MTLTENIMELLLTFDKNSSLIEDRFTKELKSLIKLSNSGGLKAKHWSIYEFNDVLDEPACVSKFDIEDNGKIVRANYCGVCASENFSYEVFAAGNSNVWIGIGSGSRVRTNSSNFYCPSFHEDSMRITVYLDMNKRTYTFTVNGTKYLEEE
ncbi:hypothetical protein GLOIN_2v1777850 [Rhizophagus irregularis DAOM 181602=DAOM 197198]|uniref:B30.2/SPRY domain-containing protein n=1 Tax=Rhizophagus irregularis (strain DAOM 181602 / DAOM 197198 / MUCL 43194) TaxID=747089 RepID=A0A2P4PU17_RHIID|nr:hypothetical protein GLOIN_2v1777850 [Rhizophagus irregularis DAOM 181602=DAOM 197198]POG68882.1 hypothetical protein GLOIN_2v1777850 [Rhizophagus irregularis DAOM 181602=DAOM 197198]GET60955.1 hypothetical protein GLOIN_2v1777850 [Rhizophagus irregularis DAOM 181602=DAOM 197198]|eukprot:XP_025175748.1 hypothetical protein GLOIN_2v1777850 [Rhizophagus irregularis DAOM 181602=DAOM 197198]